MTTATSANCRECKLHQVAQVNEIAHRISHNFEPQIYNMEQGALDKLIADYNTMDIWNFNEKYGDLWDFTVTVKKEDIMKR
ncbi:hypothetical protein DVH24_041651 [Malus domestica]|uniref:Uncharacterized protein n=1 Tax=Malus domestica TaxID=3750 RepID=A0A498IU53_MALDO|nr:hypothetical protein DVH24_041651 [Malus domestica]